MVFTEDIEKNTRRIAEEEYDLLIVTYGFASVSYL